MRRDVIDESTWVLAQIVEDMDLYNKRNFENIRARGGRLVGRSLAGINLSGSNLTKAHLEQVDLTDVSARLTDWKLVTFKQCTLDGVDFQRANLHRANFSGSTLQGADLRSANLSRANLNGVRMQGARLNNADLRRADMRGARLTGCRFGGAVLHGADLRETDVADANLEGALYDQNTIFPDGFEPEKHGLEAPPRVLAGRDLRRADLAGADLHEVNMARANLEGANLSRAMLMRVDLSGAVLEGAKLDGANLRFAKLEGANLRGASLRGADLRWASVEDADFSNANLHGADMQCGGLETALLRGAEYDSLTEWLPEFNAARAVNPPEEERKAEPPPRTERAPDRRPDQVPSGGVLPPLEKLDLSQLHPLLRELPKEGLGEFWTDLVTALPLELSRLLLDDQYLGSLSVSDDAMALINSEEHVVERIAWDEPFKVGLGAWPLSEALIEVTVTLSQRVDVSSVSRLEFRVALPQHAVSARVPLQQSSEPYLEREDFLTVWPVILGQFNMHEQGLRGLLAPPESW